MSERSDERGAMCQSGESDYLFWAFFLQALALPL
jgi:hypothetical protein